MNLTPELRRLKNEIRAYAVEFGLDFFETFFELLEFDEVNEIAAYGGFPTRYPHWRFGMAYERLAKGYTYGLQKIYELVINNDPCYAYLMRSNAIVDQKIVIAHVFAHSDFFKNNMWFSQTNRKMIDQMANHGTRVRRYVDRVGQERVEEFLDCCLALENLIDAYSPYIQRTSAPAPEDDKLWEEGRVEDRVGKLKSKDYMDRYINPPEYIEEQRQKLAEKAEQAPRFPAQPERDLLKFLLDHAPLRKWEQDILSIIRDEAYYFAPQGMTKIMNEGWASYWHAKIMTERALVDSEVVDFADIHSGILATAPGGLNPYKLGVELFRDIEDRWNSGRFGKEWEECDDAELRANWNRDVGKGREKIFEVRRVMNDVSFIDAFLTEEFCHRQKLFLYDINPHTGRLEVTDREFAPIKSQLLRQLTNSGQPRIDVVDGNHGNRGELYLQHRWDQTDLRIDYAKETLKSVFRLWGRPVHLETILDEKPKLISYDGEKVSMQDVAPVEV